MNGFLLLDFYSDKRKIKKPKCAQYKTPYFSKHGFLYEEYYHWDYGLYSDDAWNTIVYVNGMLKKLNDLENIESSADAKKEYLQCKAELLQDYRNYLSCLSLAVGERNIFYKLTHLLLTLDMVTEVYNVIKEYYSSNLNGGFSTHQSV